jgi:sorbitol-specific phosphotransferase system component IIA
MWSNMMEIGHNTLEINHKMSNLMEIGQVWSNIVEIGHNMAEYDGNMVIIWPNMMKIGHNMVKYDESRS